MTWLHSLRERGGALLGPAEHLLREEHPSLGGLAFRGGTRGLLALARTLEEWVDHDGIAAMDEERFVERAGALLGLILIDHVGDAKHQSQDGLHRVKLGKYGYFDPFRAVEDSLQASDVRRQLAREVARAEAEAAGRGPLSRVVDALARALQEQRPHLYIASQFDACVVLSDGCKVDLARTVRATSGESDQAVNTAVLRLVSMLPQAGGTSALTWQQAAPHLLPRLCVSGQLEDLSQRSGCELWRRPWAGPLHAALVLHYGDRARYVREDEVQRWRSEGAQPVVDALTNLAKRSGGARWARVDTQHGPTIVSRTGDGLDSARLMLPGLFNVLSRELGPRIRVGVPHRDLLIACPADVPALVASVHARVVRDHARAPHALSDELFMLDAQGVHRPGQALRMRAST